MSEKHICPVCGFNGLDEKPFDQNNQPSYEICPSCGFESGFDGANDPEVLKKLRQQWMKSGFKNKL